MNFLLSLEEDVEVLTVAVDEADTVDPVESKQWIIYSHSLQISSFTLQKTLDS